jgi:hypothetical protein
MVKGERESGKHLFANTARILTFVVSASKARTSNYWIVRTIVSWKLHQKHCHSLMQIPSIK